MNASNDQSPLLAAAEEGEAPSGEGRCSGMCGKLHAKVTGLGSMIPAIVKARATMLAATAAMLVDQYLDGGVASALHDGLFKSFSLLLALSIVVPQVIAWAFLRQSGMASLASLLRVLLFPIIGASLLAYLWWAGAPRAGLLEDVALFSTALSVEPIIHLYRGWTDGKEVEECFWHAVSEGLIEAPASAGLTLYPSMLLSVHSHEGPSWLFVLSSVWSLAMVTRASTKLHFYGLADKTGFMEYAKVMVLMKFPQVVSQVLGFVLFAFLTRPLPEGIRDAKTFTQQKFELEISGKSLSTLIFPCMAQELVLNFGTLKTISPSMDMRIAALFAATMVVGSPPGFLRALDGARLGHALQHMVQMLFMAAVAVTIASEAHWEVLRQEYPIFIAMFLTSVPWAFLASVLMQKEMTIDRRLNLAQEQLAEALSSNDRLMSRLLVDVEGVDARATFEKALDDEQADICDRLIVFLHEVKDYCRIKLHAAITGGDSHSLQKLLGVPGVRALMITELDEAAGHRALSLIASQSNNQLTKQLLDAGVDPKVPFDKASAENNVGACSLLFGLASDIRDHVKNRFATALASNDQPAIQQLVVATQAGGLNALDLALAEGDSDSAKQLLAAGVRPDCAVLGADHAVVDLGPKKNALAFIDAGRGRGESEWSGCCACAGRVYFCPYNAAQVLVLDPPTGAISFLDTGRGAGGYKWQGCCECAGRVYFCPANAAQVLVLDPPTGAISFLDTGKGAGGDKWMGCCECAGRVYFCPLNAAQVLVLDPPTGAISFLDTGKGAGGNKWDGCCECAGRVYFCPFNDAQVMVLAVWPEWELRPRWEQLRRLGLEATSLEAREEAPRGGV